MILSSAKASNAFASRIRMICRWQGSVGLEDLRGRCSCTVYVCEVLREMGEDKDEYVSSELIDENISANTTVQPHR